jgi:multidrug efflux pump subunit AcrA (membrane-fusion protein)
MVCAQNLKTSKPAGAQQRSIMLREPWIQTFWKDCALLVLAIELFSLGCGSRTASNKTINTNQKSNGEKSQAVNSALVKVTTAPVVAKDVPGTIRATGSFTAKESSDVSPQVSGQIIATPVNVGDTVQSGQVIARLDDRDARAKLQQASASLQQAQASAVNAKAEAQRSAGLVKTGDISQSDYAKLTTQVDTANAQVAQAQSDVTLAKRALEESVVRAPFRGHVSERS